MRSSPFPFPFLSLLPLLFVVSHSHAQLVYLLLHFFFFFFSLWFWQFNQLKFKIFPCEFSCFLHSLRQFSTFFFSYYCSNLLWLNYQWRMICLQVTRGSRRRFSQMEVTVNRASLTCAAGPLSFLLLLVKAHLLYTAQVLLHTTYNFKVIFFFQFFNKIYIYW